MASSEEEYWATQEVVARGQRRSHVWMRRDQQGEAAADEREEEEAAPEEEVEAALTLSVNANVGDVKCRAMELRRCRQKQDLSGEEAQAVKYLLNIDRSHCSTIFGEQPTRDGEEVLDFYEFNYESHGKNWITL
jgi:hypothetical protein